MRRGILETPVERPTVLARALRPDHTDEMTTDVVDGTIRTEITRPSTASLRSTMDDYIVNLVLADRIDAIATAQFPIESDTTDTPTPNNQ